MTPLVTTNGSNTAPAVLPALAANAAPTLSQRAMIMLVALLVPFGVTGIRRHAM